MATRDSSETIEATDEFGLALSLLREKAPFVLVTGQAGTGKTTCIRWIREQFAGNVVVVAPTGLAALTAGGQTIHSFFGFPPRWVEPQDIVLRPDPAVYQKLDLLIIDEISMVRCDLIDAIDRFLRINRGQRDPDNCELPFGGAQVMAMGDLFQLPPVVQQEDLERLQGANYLSPHFFSAKALKGVVPATVELTRPFRQKDMEFLDLLRCVREDRDVDRALVALNGQCHDALFDDESWLAVVPTRQRAELINTQRLEALPGESRTYRGSLEGNFLSGINGAHAPNPDAAERNLPAPYELRLKQGARVIFTKNDPGRRWVNGTMGTAEETDERGVTVRIDGAATGGPVQVDPVRWKKERHVWDKNAQRIVLKETGAYTQLPLAPAWAITIHKVQGQTVDRICVDLDQGAFATGQTYVAISRCRSLEGLRLRRPISRADVRSDPQIKRFMEAVGASLANRLLEPSDEQEPEGGGDDRPLG